MMLKTPSLLITDDNPDFRETLREVFAPRGYRTLMASNGEEALGIATREKIHLALLDMHMPKVTGLQLVHQTRRLKRPVPFILISAALDDRIVAEATEANAIGVLSKPVRFREITMLVEEAMRRMYGWPDAGQG